MKAVAIDSAVLAGQGCVGSYGLGTPNPAPGVGLVAGAEATLSPAVDGSAAEAAVKMPDQYLPTGPTNEPDSQYSVPVQKG